jgi:hypothetical protein
MPQTHDSDMSLTSRQQDHAAVLPELHLHLRAPPDSSGRASSGTPTPATPSTCPHSCDEVTHKLSTTHVFIALVTEHETRERALRNV